MRKYLLKATILTAVLALAGWVAFTYLPGRYYSPVFPYVLIFFYIFSVVTHTVQLSRLQSGFVRFARIHMIVTLVRLFVYTALVIVYLTVIKDNTISFVAVVAVLYVTFSLLETWDLTRNSAGAGNRSGDG